MKQIPVEKKVSGSSQCPENIIMETIDYALVDDKYYAELNQYIWVLTNGYARRSNGKNCIYMQHDIWCRLEGHPYTKLDHADRNSLNNQLSNLRPATWSQNNANMGLRANSTTGYKGVTWSKQKSKYKAQIQVNKKNLHLGLFHTALEAAKAYDAAALKHFGEFAVTNKALGLLS